MSPSVGNFVHDLVEMAKAMETLPQVQAENDRLHSAVEDYAKQVQDREISIINLKNEIEALNNRVRDAEVARDDAELRFLELDEKADLVSKLLHSIRDTAEGGYSILNPLKPEPQPVPEPIKPFTIEQLDDMNKAQGQSESNHTTVSTAQDASTGSVQETVIRSDDASTTTEEPKHRPYSDKFYYDHPVYVSLHDWLDGGGTEENYYRSKPKDYDPTHVPF